MSKSIVLIALLFVLLISCVAGRVGIIHNTDDKAKLVHEVSTSAIVPDTHDAIVQEAQGLRNQGFGEIYYLNFV